MSTIIPEITTNITNANVTAEGVSQGVDNIVRIMCKLEVLVIHILLPLLYCSIIDKTDMNHLLTNITRYIHNMYLMSIISMVYTTISLINILNRPSIINGVALFLNILCSIRIFCIVQCRTQKLKELEERIHFEIP